MREMTLAQALELAMQHHRAGNLRQAEALYRRALLLRPGHGEALNNLGVALQMMGRLAEAEECYRQAIAMQAAGADVHANLGMALQQQGRSGEAIACFHRALELDGSSSQACNNLGAALQSLGQRAEAEAFFRRAIALQAGNVDARTNLGDVLTEQGKLDEAIESYRSALALRPGSPEILACIGWVLLQEGRVDEAIPVTRQALAMRPDSPAIHSDLLFEMLLSPTTDAATLAEEQRRWNQRHALPLASGARPHGNDRSPERRLRIGYVSPHLRAHIIGWLMKAIVARHDHGQFEIACYSDARPDDCTARIKDHADLWRDTAHLSDEQLADQIRQDRIDILVDLAAHTEGNRLSVFARKPAPVQVTYLGCPASTGLTSIDYRLTDRHLSPDGQSPEGPEKLVYLPDGYWSYAPPEEAPDPGELPALGSGHVVFGALNNFMKANEQVLGLWAEVLRAVPGSRIMVLARGGEGNDHIPRLMQRQGIARERVILVDHRPPGAYLRLYREIDIALDPFPYTGHTTSHDALYMGVPVVTLAGQRAVSRAGVSILANLELTELIAQSPGQYVGIAADLAADLPRLAELRRSLRGRMRQSPIMDGRRFVRSLEGVYRELWRAWCGADSAASR